MEYSLVDVSNAICSCRPSTFNRLRCFVMNYIADTEFPHKFFYNGCSVSRANGTYCARASCEHASRFSTPLYRFQLQLTDCSPSPPVTVTIFYQAHILMKISAKQFSSRSPEAQLAMVREKTLRGEMCDIYIKVKEDIYSGEFVAVVQLLSHVDSNEDEVLNELMRTPSSSPGLARSPWDFQTPRGEESSIGRSSAGECSSQRRGTGSRSTSSRLSNVKTKMQDLEIAILDLTTTDE